MKFGLRGRGIKALVKKKITSCIKSLFPVGTLYNAPRAAVSIQQLQLKSTKKDQIHVIPVFQDTQRNEIPPLIYNYHVSNRFKKYDQRKIPAAYVAALPRGMVYGSQSNFVITHSRKLVSDLSREFGMYGGKPMNQSSVLTSVLKLPPPLFIAGKVAVITTSGANNFHHWNYDCIPRLHLLERSGILNEIDKFIISHNDLPFQTEAMRIMGIENNKVINPFRENNPLFQAEILYAASLPSELGTVSPWVVDFLRDLYNPRKITENRFERIYLSRKNVKSRKIVNNQEFMELLSEFKIVEVFPEDYSVAQMARLLAGARFIISVHGSGLSNLCFVTAGTTIIDILAPYHQDGYYWMISNIRNAKYIGFFGEGDHPKDTVDLVKNKIDDDIYLDIKKMHTLLTRELSNHENI